MNDYIVISKIQEALGLHKGSALHAYISTCKEGDKLSLTTQYSSILTFTCVETCDYTIFHDSVFDGNGYNDFCVVFSTTHCICDNFVIEIEGSDKYFVIDGIEDLPDDVFFELKEKISSIDGVHPLILRDRK